MRTPAPQLGKKKKIISNHVMKKHFLFQRHWVYAQALAEQLWDLRTLTSQMCWNTGKASGCKRAANRLVYFCNAKRKT